MGSMTVAPGEDVRPFDLRRLFLGDEPPLFLLEIAFRTVFIFLFTLLLLRVVGKRGVGQLSLFEVSIIIGLGSAVGDPMFQADVPLSHAMIVITLVVFLYRGVITVVNRYYLFERFVEGETTCIAKDGVLDLDQMRRDHFGREEIFEMFRGAGITQLGEVKRAYLEQGGNLTIFAFPPAEVRAGLPLLPPWDVEHPEEHAVGAHASSGSYACMACGVVRIHDAGPLPRCGCRGGSRWTPAVRAPLGEGRVVSSG